MRARGAIPLVAIVAVSIAFPGSAARAAAVSRPSRLFAPGSVWNRPVAASARLDPSSRRRVAWLLRYLRQPGHGPWINVYQYSVPVYRVSAKQATVRVVLDGWAPALGRAWRAVPLPRRATPAAGTDGALVVWQPSRDRMWEFWQLHRVRRRWHARWGGAMAHVSSNPGYYSSSAWPRLSGLDGWNWGSSASGLPAVAGVMTVAELRARHIDHALSVATPEACAGWFVWPAQRTDGVSTDRDCLPEGAHLRLDPRLDLRTLNLPPVALAIAQAMQRYGIIVHDTSHASLSLFAEDPTSGSDPYVGPEGVFDGLQEWQFLPLIPWDRLQLLAMHRCSRSPCITTAARRRRSRRRSRRRR